MEQSITKGEQNLMMLQDLMPESERIYVWCYTDTGEFVASNCPLDRQKLLDDIFRAFGGMDRLKEYAADTEMTVPKIIGSPIGMQWALTYESERERSLVFVLGPVFYSRPKEQQIRNVLADMKPEWEEKLYAFLPKLSVMAYTIFIRYILLIHNTLTGQQIGMEDLNRDHELAAAPDSSRNRTSVYQAEKTLLAMVRNGDINYFEAFRSSSSLSTGVPVEGQDPLRQMKTSIIVFTSLVCRAAMEGGLPPETAYPLGDSYIQTVEDCRDSGELGALAHAMYHDFIYRVHHLRENTVYSNAIRKCCDYISLSLDRKIKASDLASLTGYTEYYLSEKFKKETGMSLNTYIRNAKTARARVLLETTDLSVHEIADRLAFNTPNYFIQSFRETEGMTPAQYRRASRKEA